VKRRRGQRHWFEKEREVGSQTTPRKGQPGIRHGAYLNEKIQNHTIKNRQRKAKGREERANHKGQRERKTQRRREGKTRQTWTKISSG